MRGLRSTIVLIVVLGGLIGYIYYLNRDGAPDADAKETAFAAVSADDIEEVQIKSADGETSRAQKTDGTWRLVEPIQAAADESELTSIASSLAALEMQRVIDENAPDLKQYGLEPARVEVSFRTKGDKDAKRILFGERTPTGGDLYARFPDQNRVFLVSSFLDSTFNKGSFALRDKSIVQVDREQIDRIEIAAGQRMVTLAKSGAEWRIVEPSTLRADFGAVEGALERLASARMQAIVAPEGGDLKRYKLDPPIATFAAVSGNSRATLLFGDTENAVIYAKDAARPMVFSVAPTLYTDLIRDVQDFRRKDLFDLRSFTASRVEFRRGGETIVLEKAKGADGKDVWRSGGKDVDAMKADDLLTKVSSLRAESFESAPNAALKTPVLTVVAQFGDDNRMEQVTFARAGSDVVASRSDEPGTATVDAAGFDDTMKALDAVK
jgi:hypothetical protein